MRVPPSHDLGTPAAQIWDLGARGFVSSRLQPGRDEQGHQWKQGNLGHSRYKGPLPWNRNHPTPPGLVLLAPPFPASGIASSSAPGIFIPQCLHPAPQPGLPWSIRRPQHAIAYSPGSASASHALLASLRGTRHVPAAAFIRAGAGRGGAEQGGACGLARLAPYAGLHRAPCGRPAAQAAQSKGEVPVTVARKQRVGRGRPQGHCQQVSREMEGIARDEAPPCGQGVGARGERVLSGQCPGLRAGVRRPEVIERLGCGKRPQSREAAFGVA